VYPLFKKGIVIVLPKEEEIHFSGIEIDLLSGSKGKHQSIELSLLIFLDTVIPYCILKLTPDWR